jgi:hypothetical protein
MLYQNIDPENTADVTIQNYLTVLGRELSDLIDVNSTRIIKGKFREQKEDNYIHALYSVHYKRNINLIIHVQAHSVLSFDPMDPLIRVCIRETSRTISRTNEKTKKSLPIKELLEQNNYGQYPLQVAVRIAHKYDRFCNHSK